MEEINLLRREIIEKENFQDYVLKKIPTEWSDYDAILGEEIILKKYKISKIIKHAPKKFLKNPKFFLKKNQNIKLHFDVFHGEGESQHRTQEVDGGPKGSETPEQVGAKIVTE